MRTETKFLFRLFGVDFFERCAKQAYSGGRVWVFIAPRSSEWAIPLIGFSTRLKFGFFKQFKKPFGLYIGLGFIHFRWGSA